MSRKHAILPGSFNPLHDGHRQMRIVAERKLSACVCYELSVANVDKPDLPATEIERRLAQFGDATCWITTAPTFAEKSKLFPGATFLVGADTITRIADVCYYANQVAVRDQAIEEIRSRGCRFLVFGRQCGGEFHELPALKIDPALRDICDTVAMSEFRVDVSSSELRGAYQSKP